MSATVLKPDPYSPEWREFCDELRDLLGPGDCRKQGPIYEHDRDRPEPFYYATGLLVVRGHDVEATLALFEKKGGYCDCEILLNLDTSTLEEELALLLGDAER